MYKILSSFLFMLDAEKAHHLTLNALKLILKIPFKKAIFRWFFTVKSPKLEKELFGIKFPNPVGLAAGFDKNAKYIDELACLGFGFIEIGTVTPLPQAGNPLPRLFRLKKDKAIINRMGFNNEGVDAAVERLKKRKSDIIIGGNIGKNKVTPNDKAVEDYKICFTKLFDVVDYFVVNVSSPNTPGLRELQEKDKLSEILNELQKLNFAKENPKPILLKIAPDLTNTQLDDIVDVVNETKIQGLISSNTTNRRDPLVTVKTAVDAIGNGGLSGLPVRDFSNEVLAYLHKKSEGKFLIIGVGGIMNAEDAKTKMSKGADLVQVYSGFIYAGPSLPKMINKLLAK
ncbi:MAG: dihydroorotate dehydrogenase [Planctomycetota bacterium]|jgi:dihydroorotate dehydrogenase